MQRGVVLSSYLVLFSELECFEVSGRFIDYQLKQNFLLLTCSCQAGQLPCQCWECLIWEKLMSRVVQQLAVLSSQCKFSLRSVECNWWGWLGGRWTSLDRTTGLYHYSQEIVSYFYYSQCLIRGAREKIPTIICHHPLNYKWEYPPISALSAYLPTVPTLHYMQLLISSQLLHRFSMEGICPVLSGQCRTEFTLTNLSSVNLQNDLRYVNPISLMLRYS